MTKKLTILFFSASRSEFGIIKELIKKFRLEKNLKIEFIISGSHLSSYYGKSIKEVQNEKVKINKIFKINISKPGYRQMGQYFEKLLKKSFDYFEKKEIDYLFIVGDRVDMLPLAIAAKLKNIKICHLQGGELTSELIDDYLRHMYTKISDFHFTANNNYKKRVIQMGENPKRVFSVGSASIDEIKTMDFKKKKELEKILKIKLDNQIFLVTYQPLSLNLQKTKQEISILLKALLSFKDKIIIFTFPNYDIGNQLIINSINKFKKKFKKLYVYHSLGKVNYLSLAKIADLVIGNSSSGVIEIPYLGTNVIDIGPRQKGRIKDRIVSSIKSDTNVIIKSIKKSITFKKKIKNQNIYGNGRSVKKIIKVFQNKVIKYKKKKDFFDIDFKL